MSGQRKALVLVIGDQNVQLLLWRRHALTLLRDFHDAQEGQQALPSEIRKFPDYPVLVVADLIDESFRHDHIVHVTGSDRSALLKRKLDFAFRNTPYRLGRIKGREREGRRLDKLLMAAINKPEAIDTWVRLLLEEKCSIQCITSMAWLLRDYVALHKLDRMETLLIVNLEPDNVLRQSFFQSGKLLFSRLTTLNTRNSTDLEDEIYQETLQVRQYLERIQFVGYEAPLQILVLTTLPAGELDLQDRSTSINNFEIVECGDNDSVRAVNGAAMPLGPMHSVMVQVLERKRPHNIYGPAHVTRYYDLLRLGRQITVAAGLLLCAGLIANLPLAHGVRDKWEQTVVFTNRTLPLQSQYAELSENFPTTPIPSSEMALLVEAYDRLTAQSFSPLPALNMVSSALSMTDSVMLTRISWQLVEMGPSPATPGMDNMDGEDTMRRVSGATPDTAFTAAVLQGRIRLKVVLEGQAWSDNSFREAQDQVEKLIAALAQNSGVSVFASRMPTDVRTDIAVSTKVGDGEIRAPFALELTLSGTSLSSQVAMQR